MFKKSILILLIRIVGLVLSFLYIYIVADDMGPAVYSLTGIYQVVTAAMLNISGWGIEILLCRENLYWKRIGEVDKIEEYTSQAIVSRIIACAVLTPIAIIYLSYINRTKYENAYTLLFAFFIIGAIMNAFIDAFRNIVQSGGGYVFSQTMGTINATVIRTLGLVVFIKFGSMPYLYFYALSPIIILACFVVKCRNSIKLKYFKLRPTFQKVWAARYLWLKNYLEYFRLNTDSALVSVLFTNEIMGVYTVYKSLEAIMRNFVTGFFDVLSQHMVYEKGNKEKLKALEKKIKMARNIVLSVIVLGIFIYFIDMDWFVSLIHLNKYTGIKWFVLVVAINGLIFVAGKYEINTVYFFATTKMNFIMAIINTSVMLLTYIVIAFYPNLQWLAIQQIIGYLISSLLAITVYYRNKAQILGQINN